MDSREQIIQSIISCRNILLGGKATDNVIPQLQEVASHLSLVPMATTRKVLEFSVLESINQIRHGAFRSAGFILHLVHNLPLDDLQEEKWNVDYFLSMELPQFLDHFDEIISARRIIFFIIGQISSRYQVAQATT